MRLHYRKRLGAVGQPLDDQERPVALAYGARIGLWPCIPAPYVQLAWGRYRYSWWVTR